MSRLALWLAFLSVSGCIYDHRMTQAILERRRRAKEAEGARIGASRAPVTQRPTRYSARVRFYVSDDFRRQHPGWRGSLEDVVDASSAVLGSAFALRFEATELREWSPHCERLELCLDELAALDAGAEDLWIVGVLGDEPRYSSTFETLGLANIVSSHFVLRDVADLAERKAIDDAFPTHTEGQRSEIYKRRKAHKRLAIFLHEWAHTVGGLHSPEVEDLLHPSYDDREASFGYANAGLIEVGLQSRYERDEGRLRDYVQGLDASRFTPGEHAKLAARLQREPTTSSAATALPSGAPSTSQPSTSEPSSSEENACARAMRIGDFAAAEAACPRHK